MDEEDLNKFKNMREGMFWTFISMLYYFMVNFIASFISILIYMFKDLYTGVLKIEGLKYFYNGEPLDYTAYSIRTSTLTSVLILPLMILGIFIFSKIKKIKFTEVAASGKFSSGKNALGLIAGIALMFPISCIVAYSFIGELSPDTSKMISDIIDSTPFWLSFLALAICAPIQEELLMRGFVQGRLEKTGFKPYMTILFQAVLFGMLHMNLQQFIYATILGIIFGIMRYLSKSIWPCIFAHIGFNGTSVILDEVLKHNDWAFTKWLSVAIAAVSLIIFAIVFYIFETACRRTADRSSEVSRK